MSETPPPRTERDETQLLMAGIGVIALAVVLVIVLAFLDDRDTAPDRAVEAGSWLDGVTTNLGQRGYDWIRIDVEDGVATVSGEARDVDSRAYGFEAAEKAIDRADADDTVRLVVDATRLEGARASVGEALTKLGRTPSAGDCEQAFAATLDGRSVEFTAGGADLTTDNKRLLDALAGIATRCKAHRIEIGGHTDRAGDTEARIALSQARAEAVLQSLTDRGVPAAALSAHGYGDRRPVDRRRTPAADARNRRIEFTVSAS